MSTHGERSASSSDRDIPALDGLRGIAVLLVMVHHGVLITSPEGSRDLLYRLATFGWVGVDIFFVLSGFLITRILIDYRDGPQYFQRFYVRRALRIFPLYYAMLLFLLAAASPVHFLSAEDSAELRHYQLWYWTYLVNFRLAILPRIVHQQGDWASVVPRRRRAVLSDLAFRCGVLE